MKLFNLFLISFLMGATPFVVSFDRGMELVDSVTAEEATVSVNERQTPHYLDADPTAEISTIVNMD